MLLSEGIEQLSFLDANMYSYLQKYSYFKLQWNPSYSKILILLKICTYISETALLSAEYSLSLREWNLSHKFQNFFNFEFNYNYKILLPQYI